MAIFWPFRVQPSLLIDIFLLMEGNEIISVRKGSSNEEGSLERGKLRTKLFNFMKSRPTKESLEQKGIIKGHY